MAGLLGCEHQLVCDQDRLVHLLCPLKSGTDPLPLFHAIYLLEKPVSPLSCSISHSLGVAGGTPVVSAMFLGPRNFL